MMSYRDMTFCTYDDCRKFRTCNRALTQEVKDRAEAWWGNEDAPICCYAEHPACFEEEEE